MRLVLAFVAAALGALALHQAAGAAGVPGISDTGPGCIRMSVAGATNEAGLKITFEHGHTVEYCIEFSEPEITGAQLLARSGLPIVTQNSGLGAAVCSIDGQGCNDPGDCFCRCRGGTCAYWAYFQRKNGAWQYSPQGAGLRAIRDGDADAWVWGSGTSSPGAAVDCAERTSTPSPPPPPTATRSATRTATPVPTDVAETARSTNTPQATATAAAAAPSPTAGTGAGAPPAPAAPTSSPSSGVLGEASARTPSPVTTTEFATTTPAGGTRTALASPTRVRTPTGTIRVSESEGQRNEERQSSDGDWAWSSIGTFGAVVLVLGAVAGGVFWRRRGAG